MSAVEIPPRTPYRVLCAAVVCPRSELVNGERHRWSETKIFGDIVELPDDDKTRSMLAKGHLVPVEEA